MAFLTSSSHIRNMAGHIFNLSAQHYVRYLLQGLYDSLHRMNLLNSKISFDLASSTRMLVEFREHLRRLLRVFFHLAYNPDHLDDEGAASDQESGESTGQTPRSPSSSPRSSPRPNGKAATVARSSGVDKGSEKFSASFEKERNSARSASRRLSKDTKPSRESAVLVPVSEVSVYKPRVMDQNRIF
jgi:hypothetical protein